MTRFIKNIARTIKKNPLFTSINSIGLIIGFVCFIFITCWIKNELSYDRLHDNAGKIYRVHRYWYDTDGKENLHLPYVAPPIAPLLKDEFSEIEYIARVSHTSMLFSLGNQKILEQNVCFAEPDILKMFTFKGLHSDPDLLEEPLTAVISESIAKKYFEGKEAYGNTMEFSDEYGNRYNLIIKEIFKDWEGNNHFSPEIFISFSTYVGVVNENEMQDWGSNNYETFAQMQHPPKELNARLDAFINKQFENGTSWTKIRMEKLTDIHFNWYERRSNIYILSSIALLILFLGSINYMNLNTAIYTKRVKEIQIRKITGAKRSSIASALILESILFCILSLLVALAIVLIILPRFEVIFNRILLFKISENIYLIIGFIILSILIGILSGLYPAIFTMSNKMSALYKVQNSTPGKTSFRNTLVVFQFLVSIVLIISFLTVSKQLNFLQNKNLGINKENVITLNASPILIEKLDVFRQELIKNPKILNVSGSKRIPSQRLDDSNGARVLKNGEMERIGFRLAFVLIDKYFLPTYEINLIAGKNISNENTGENEYLINQTAVEEIGWETPEDAIGQFIRYGGTNGKIVGVIQDFNYESLHNEMVPIILFSQLSGFDHISIRVSPHNINSTIAYIEKEWQKFNMSGISFSYQFVNDSFNRLYQSEKYTKKIFSYFMVLAIVICILGLFGLSVYVMERRIKEIGVRKVNGARTLEILALLNKEFTKWVIIAFGIATPLAWFLMNKWLENFAYKTELSWWVFLLGGILALSIAWLTVSWQSWRAATRNPVEALRYE